MDVASGDKSAWLQIHDAGLYYLKHKVLCCSPVVVSCLTQRISDPQIWSSISSLISFAMLLLTIFPLSYFGGADA
jgi:hypothetical protein